MKNKNTNQPNLVERFNPTIEQGLTDAQVYSRLEQGLVNKVKASYSKSYLNIFVNNLCTFFNLLGLICFIALLLIKASIGNFFFVFFYIANISIGIIQEIRAKKCIDKLTLISSKKSKVFRNGKLVEIATDEIVLDDVIYLGIGNQIPTDCIILNGEIEVNESLLTGESIPVKKKTGDLLLAGSFITSGVCHVKAEKVGADNYVQTLSAKAKQYKKPNSEIMNSLKLIIKGISFIIVPLAVALMLKFMLGENDSWQNAILGTSTVVIGMIPAGLMLLTSVALAVGIIKLATHKTLVQDLYSLEMLARVDTICFDKTGTITDGNMTVHSVIKLNDNFDPSPVISSMVFALKDQNQTAKALENYFGCENHLTAIKTLPFDSKRKMCAVTFENKGTFAYGAPEFLLNKEEYAKLKDDIEKYAKQGYRVLVFAQSDKIIDDDYVINDFIPLSLIIIADNVREEAIKTIQWFKDNDVAVKVISGDNPITVSEVSKRVGIENADKYISLEGLTDQEVFDSANKYTVFGRVSPEQKAILVKALKSAGHVTAMTGDGVNDILALKESDCAITVAEGSDAARNVSHIVLLDNNFNSMPEVVYEGRRVINNVQSSASLFLMKTFFTLFMGLITLFLFKEYPFRLPHMIMIEMLVIGMPAFCLSFQPNDSRVSGKFINHVISKSFPGAILMLLSVAIILVFEKYLPFCSEETFTAISVYSFTLAGTINLFITCRPLNKFRTFLFIGCLIIILSVMTFFMFMGFGNDLTPIIPAENYYHLLLLFGIFIIELPIAMGLHRLFKNFNFPTIKRKK